MANSRLCSITDCGKKHDACGYCKVHYMRMRRHGDPLFSQGTEPGKVKEFYETTVLKYEGDECLIWPYSRHPNGYGTVSKDGKTTGVSRLVCKETCGDPPTPDHEAAHSCGNGHLGCVTKRHLSWKTPKGNCADKLIHGTLLRGEKHNMAKLTEAQVIEIRALLGKNELQKDIAEKYGVSFFAVSDIKRGKSWGWLE